MDDVEAVAAVDGDGSLAGAAAVRSAAGDGHFLARAGGPRGDGLALGSAEEGVVAFAGVVGAVGAEGGGQAVVDVLAGEGVVFGAQAGWGGEVHVCLSGWEEGEKEGEEVRVECGPHLEGDEVRVGF